MRYILPLAFCAASTSSLAPAPSTACRRGDGVRMAVGGATECSDITVMVNGLPGAMGLEVSEACARRGMELAEVALTGPGQPGAVEVAGKRVKLVDGSTAEADQVTAALVARCAAESRVLIAVDYTVPAAALPNAELYARHGVSFVMGTTGGDREKLADTVTQGRGHSAVIAPNMAKQIVALQATLDYAAREFPGAFDGYALDVIESHQATKQDTSGTAKAIVGSLVALKDAKAHKAGDVEEAIEAIVRVRDEATQLDGAATRLNKVPADHIKGHAYHTYGLTSNDGTVRFEVRHNVNGRRTYAEGTADAVNFLAKRITAAGATPSTLYSMIDVLRAGELA